MPARLDAGAPGFEDAFARLLDARVTRDAGVDTDVAGILADVRARGDEALFELTERFDGHRLDAATIAAGADEIAAAAGRCEKDVIAALELAASRIRAFHEKQLPADLDYEDEAGLRLGYRWHPIAKVGLYVPGGLAAYPSSVLMNAIPAKVAGVSELVMVVPAPGGALNPLLLAVARIAGVDRVLKIGGAQAIAALAYGTRSVEPVDKIVGPGNAWVAAAKRQVFGAVGIDMIAGPSEILVLADAANDPRWIAADLLSQAEHDPRASAVLITDDAGFAEKVCAAVDETLASLPRAEIAAESWERCGAVIVVAGLGDAVPLIDRVAPEHLELAVAEPEAIAAKVRNAGAIFLGRFTPEAIGDYVAGPNHVLPTSGSARFSSGLGVLDFLKRSSIVGGDKRALRAVGPAAATLARAEGLDAHALSVSVRLDADDD